ncbi:MAG TPA: class I tRNA ligase family protein, partial [Candidatus Limnocylindrales bacterium]|nr:class I tRNA ligase family protein [Candidatus Limnocylindrales bacterium]
LFNQGQILGEDGERMSKSHGNVQDPDELVARYGADTVRLFVMFMKPWEADAPWSPRGITGTRRFLDRVWTVTLEPHGVEGPDQGGAGSLGTDLRRSTHRTLRDVTADYEGYRFNTLIAKLMELTNALMRVRGTPLADGPDYADSVRALLLMLAPIAPHVAEELWARRLAAAGEEWRSIHREPWPDFDPTLAASDHIELPVQINGRLRDLVSLPAGLSETEVEQIVLARDKVLANLEGREIVRVVHVAGRLVNIVVR